MENRLDNLFRNQLSKHEESPSPKAWEQIHDNLASKRNKLWVKRLAIAASFLLIASIGFVGYRSLKDIKVKDTPELAESNYENNAHTSNPEPESNEEAAYQNIQTIEEEKSIPVSDESLRGNSKTTIVEVEEVKEDGMKILNNKNITTESEFAEKKVGDDKSEVDIREDKDIDTTIELNQIEQNPKDMVAEVVERNVINNQENLVGQKKEYPKVRIIYKANKNSGLVASSKKTIINKGINKITDFSDEHLLTQKRKTKLRNTKEDLLALNFGKLLNKSDRDIEN